jgi:hypothetical protein
MDHRFVDFSDDFTNRLIFVPDASGDVDETWRPVPQVVEIFSLRYCGVRQGAPTSKSASCCEEAQHRQAPQEPTRMPMDV